jgi:S1-C subfamily serine protease
MDSRKVTGLARHSRGRLGWLWFGLCLLVLAASILAFPSRWRSLLHLRHDAVALLPGLTVENAPPPRTGLIVTSLRTGSEAAQTGIAVGDDIERLDGRPIDEIDDAIAYLRQDRNPAVLLRIEHGSQVRDVRLVRSGEARHGA